MTSIGKDILNEISGNSKRNQSRKDSSDKNKIKIEQSNLKVEQIPLRKHERTKSFLNKLPEMVKVSEK